MKTSPPFILLTLAITAGILLITESVVAALSRDVTIIIHPRGVYSTRVTLLGLNESKLFKPVTEAPESRMDQPIYLKVPSARLPGEFVLRFDYRDKESASPYPSEKYFFINQQDLELWVNPVSCNNPDSTWFQKGESENSAFASFSQENKQRKDKLEILRAFLMNDGETKSAFYRSATKEYEKRRVDYNKWLAERATKDSSLFVSSLYRFQYVPKVAWHGTERERYQNLIDTYFDGIDFGNPQLIRTAELSKWMDGYVNLYGQLATTARLRDSLFSVAGSRAIEKARKGDPHVYGWMVDYFYRGYESNGIDAGMKILEPYMADPQCLTNKRKEINRRLEGIATLIPGAKAPDIQMRDANGGMFSLKANPDAAPRTLILFWSAGCSHCLELTGELYAWQHQPGISPKLDVVAISLDETETDIAALKIKQKEYSGWRHLHDPQGVRSKVANDYFILATPVMIVIDSKTGIIESMPATIQELRAGIDPR